MWVKLADFGIARDVVNITPTKTVIGSIMGSPGYMSPEQAAGEPATTLSDLFSVGVVGYEMIAGFNPFGAGGSSDTATVLYRVIHEPAPALPLPAGRGSSIDPCPALMAALSKNPSNRPPDGRKVQGTAVRR